MELERHPLVEKWKRKQRFTTEEWNDPQVVALLLNLYAAESYQSCKRKNRAAIRAWLATLKSKLMP
jgi:hypothetical protein